MVSAGFDQSRQIAQPVTGVLLLALLVLAMPSPSMAQRRGAPARAAATCPQPEPYTLGAGDRIQLDVFNVPEYSREYQVLADGSVNLALIGRVTVRGLTLEAASNTIRGRYAPFLRRPIITVLLVAPRPLNVAVSGEVNRPGSYSIPITGTGAGIQFPTLTQGLRVAGGITQSANLRGVQLRRPGRGTININLAALLRGDLCQDVTLRDGDTILIPTAVGINPAEAPDIATASFGAERNQPINVVVVGEVNRPGPQIVQPDQTGALPTISRALQVAGGIRQTADLQRIQLRRPTRGGRQQTISVNLLRLLQNGDRSQDLILQQGDTVVVPTATTTNPAVALDLAAASFAAERSQSLNVVVVGEVTRPGPQIVQPDQSGAQPTVSRAIQVAGGILQTADLGRIQVRRPTRGGGQQTITVDLNQLLQNGDRTQDLILQQGDTVIVPTAAAVTTRGALDLAAASFAPDRNLPINIVVVGEVTRPGPYVVQPDQTGAVPTVTRALQVAGGIRQTSDITQVQVIRPTRGGGQQVVTVNLNQLLQGDRNQDLILQQGDTIYVPPSTTPNAADSLALSSTSFSPTGAQPLNIAVAGEVQRPGSYVLQPSQPPTVIVGALPSVAGLPTVTQAIQIAGGITQSADVRRIEVRRVTQAGVQQIISVNFWQMLVSGDRTQDLVLQQGDTIFVPTAPEIDPAEAALLAQASFSPATIPINVVGEVVRPGIQQVPPNTPLNQALLTAGGFNTRARKGQVELLRLNPNGTVSRRTIEIDFDKGTSEQENPTLRPNDVILVARSGLARMGDTLGTVLNPVNQGNSLFNIFRTFFDLFRIPLTPPENNNN